MGCEERSKSGDTSRLRVLTYNVNRVSDPLERRPILDWCAEKSKRKYDLICLQLVSKTLLDEIWQSFGRNDFVSIYQAYSKSDSYGLAVLARSEYLPKAAESHSIGEGSTYALTILLSIGGKNAGELGTSLSVSIVHLDNTCECTRLKQVNQLLDSEHVMNKSGGDPNETLLVGDFNALCKSDYSTREWEALVELARERSWEERQEVVHKRLCGDGGQFKDAALTAASLETGESKWSLCESHSYVLSLGQAKQIAHLLRLDYAFVKKKECETLQGETRLEPVYSAVDHSILASNHFPLEVHFERL